MMTLTRRHAFRLPLLLSLCLLAAACDQLGIENPAQQTARMEAEGKAMGSACRQAGRALEDCYQINARASKAAIFAGWREMDAYMRENKIDNVTPQFPMAPGGSRRRAMVDEAAEEPKAAEAKGAETKGAEGKSEPATKDAPAAKPGKAAKHG